MDKNIVTIHGSFIREFKTDIEDIGKAKQVCIKEVREYLCNRNYQITDLAVGVTKYVEIMNTLNAHDKDLVEKINFLYNATCVREKFKMILFTLAQRDKEEFEDKMFEDTPLNDCYDLIEWGKEHFEDFAYHYLTRVADDGDLEVIIDFCRYSEKDLTDTSGRGIKWLTSKGWVTSY